MRGVTVADRISFVEDEFLGGRRPLSPLSNVYQQRAPFRELAPAQSMDRYSTFGPNSESSYVYQEADEEDKFELMTVTVFIYGLAGVVCERVPVKEKRKFGRKKSLTDHRTVSSGGASTIASLDIGVSEEIHFMGNLNAPTTAVVSYQKNAHSSQHSLESFLPSIPLHHPASYAGKQFRYAAAWPSEQSSLNKDESAMERSSFNIVRCMKLGSFVPGAGIGSNYVHETFELGINLTRGTEMIRLGTATLVISGEEEGEVLMNIPAKAVVEEEKKKMGKKKQKTKIKLKPNKYGFFSNDLTRKYFLDENATLRVGIRVVPQENKIPPPPAKMEDESSRHDYDLRQMLGSHELVQIVGEMNEGTRANSDEAFSPRKPPLVPRNPTLARLTTAEVSNENVKGRGKSPSQSFLPSLFCGAGAMFCTPSFAQDQVKNTVVPAEIHAPHHGNLGIRSIISSVSESTDGSDCSDSNLADNEHITQFNMF